MSVQTVFLPGLSPLARGTHISVINRDFSFRFIPAGAGNTYQRYQPRFQFPVYPRWRGEHNLFSQVTSSPDGLSPLARGTRYLNQVLLILTRFIPAGAGNTKHERPANRLLAVYPRWRGEHIKSTVAALKSLGLSPLARGTHTP
ncbi:hypothetical protein C827_02891 [Escherichia coli SWW33]|nr:hypothetical protein C827_02891 [Escherichia coli SWW33]